MAARSTYRQQLIFGPFHRLASDTQTGVTMTRILRSGELWGRTARFGGPPRAKAYRGELPEERAGFEFFTFAAPDLNAPVVLWTAREEGSVWEEDGVAKLRVLVAKVSQDIHI